MTINANVSDQPELDRTDVHGSGAEEEVARTIEVVRFELQRPWLWPVKRKVFMMIYDRLLNLQASLLNPATDRGHRNERLHRRIIETVKLLHQPLAENAAWDVADALKELLPEVAPPEYVYWALVEEKGREPDRAHNWSEYFEAKELDGFISSYEKDPEGFGTNTPSERLVALYRIRNGEGRHDRAREGMRWRYLLWVSLLLVSSAVLLVLSWHWASSLESDSLYQMLLVSVSGAVGAVLSGTIRLRDLGRIVELQAAWKTLIPQMILGATLAMLVFLVLQTGVIRIGDFNLETAKPAEWLVVGFVSGFSEPFALGILQRITALGR